MLGLQHLLDHPDGLRSGHRLELPHLLLHTEVWVELTFGRHSDEIFQFEHILICDSFRDVIREDEGDVEVVLPLGVLLEEDKEKTPGKQSTKPDCLCR